MSVWSLVNVAAKKVGRNKLENVVFKFFFIKYLYHAQGKRFTSRRDALDSIAATRYVVSSCGLLVHSAFTEKCPHCDAPNLYGIQDLFWRDSKTHESFIEEGLKKKQNQKIESG